jgi:hypothetical protein
MSMDLFRMESFPSSVNQRISLAISMELLRMESCGGRNSFPTPGCGLHRSAQICKFSTSHQTANIHSTSRQPFASTRFAEEDFVYGVAETSSRNHPQNQNILPSTTCANCVNVGRQSAWASRLPSLQVQPTLPSPAQAANTAQFSKKVRPAQPG